MRRVRTYNAVPDLVYFDRGDVYRLVEHNVTCGSPRIKNTQRALQALAPSALHLEIEADVLAGWYRTLAWEAERFAALLERTKAEVVVKKGADRTD